jgi:hypothetical protein
MEGDFSLVIGKESGGDDHPCGDFSFISIPSSVPGLSEGGEVLVKPCLG